MLSKRALELKRKLASGEFTAGMWILLPSPSACEIIAGAALDWVVVESEHSPFNPETLQHILMAFKGSQTVPVIRVPWNDHVMIKQALDMGWDGVLVPQVNSREEAQRAVAACRYPPLGDRGYGPLRPSNYYRERDEYARIANDSVICAIQIEKVSGAEQIEDIVSVPGIDWIFVGLCDMSGTTGRFLDLENPELWEAVRKIFTVARAAGIPTGNAVSGPQNIEKAVELGSQLIVLGFDHAYLRIAVDSDVAVFRQVIGDRRISCNE